MCRGPFSDFNVWNQQQWAYFHCSLCYLKNQSPVFLDLLIFCTPCARWLIHHIRKISEMASCSHSCLMLCWEWGHVCFSAECADCFFFFLFNLMCLRTQGDGEKSPRQRRPSSPSSNSSVGGYGRYTPCRSPQNYSRPGITLKSHYPYDAAVNAQVCITIRLDLFSDW